MISIGRVPGCDIDQICGKTGARIDDEKEFMALDSMSRVIIYLYRQISSISPKEIYERQIDGGKKTMKYTLPTIINFEKIFKFIDWDLTGMSDQDALHLLIVFHNTYVGAIKNG